jgi:hypothetical protein
MTFLSPKMSMLPTRRMRRLVIVLLLEAAAVFLEE